jgi:hypothetical protein
MTFKIKDGIAIGTTNIFNNSAQLLSPNVTGSVVLNGGTSGTITLTPAAVAGTNTITLPAATGTLALTSNIPTVNAGTLTLSIGAAGATNTSITIGTGTGFDANTATNATYSLSIGPAISALASFMNTATAGFIRRSGQDTFAVDTNTYLTAEADTLQLVTGRGASSNVATVSLTASTTSSNTTSGTLVVTGGVGIGGNLNVGGNTVITGNLTVNGTTTTINSSAVSVDDINVILGDTASPTDATANGGGITLRGTTDKTFNWSSANSAWTSSEHLGLAAGKNLYILGSTSGTVTITAAATAGTPTLTLPTTTGTLALTSQLPTVNAGTLTLSIGAAGATNTSITVGTGTGFDANTATNATYSLSIGPAITNLTSTMTGGTTGFLKKTSADTYTLDTATYLTSSTGVTTFNGGTTGLTPATGTSGAITLAGTLAVANGGTGGTTTADARTGLGATTVGSNLFTLTNPSAITFLQVNANNTVSTLDAAAFRTAIGAATGADPTVTTPVATTALTQVDSFAVATIRSAKYLVQITQGSAYQVSEIYVLHNGTNTYMTEYAVLESGSALGTFTTDISGGNVRLLVTMGSASSATVKSIKTTIAV